MSVAPAHSFSRRIRRILWTAATLAAILLITLLTAWRIRKDSEPTEYVPGENSADITSVIAGKAANASAERGEAGRILPSRAFDPLRDPGRRLPQGAPEPRFTDVTEAAGLASFRHFQGPRTSQLPEDMGSGVAWGDFDNDGFDDLFLVAGGGALTLPPSQRAPSLLYRNLGNGQFQKVESFPDTRILGMAAAWGDYDNDGWLDLVVTGYDTLLLFKNDKGRFVREASFPSLKGFWAGASWGDFDRDGFLDLYICGYVKYIPGKGRASAASQQYGKEVPFTLNPASYEPERNLLFRNNRNGRFTESAASLSVDDREGRSLAALWHDFNSDGWLDLYVANDISENKLYLNNGGRFSDSGRAAWVEEYRGSMGLAAADFDRDGDDDLFISHWIAQQFALYQSLLVEQNAAAAPDKSLHFTDVAEMLGIGLATMQSIGWGASFADFDSDGWQDLAVAAGSTFENKNSRPRQLIPLPSFLFWNDRGKFFHDLAGWNRTLSEPRVARGLAVSDYDNDGAVDIAIVDHAGGVRLLRNDLPHGNWIQFRLRHNRPVAGATVVAHVAGVPLRRTLSSASYLSQDSQRIHIGLGPANRVERIEVRWPGGPTESWQNLDANRIWELTQGSRQAVPVSQLAAGPPSTSGPAGATGMAAPPVDKATLLRFWEKQRAAMDAMKRERDIPRAIQLFREALALHPGHEDSHYYLANALASQSRVAEAVGELNALLAVNAQSHRALQRKGELLAAAAAGRKQLQQAREVLQKALQLNSEETGSLVLLGEVLLALGDLPAAETQFAHACQANPRAANAYFFRAFIAGKQGNPARAREFLEAARRARGPDFKPAGAVLEGDVKRRMYSESGFLGVFEQTWDGTPNPTAFRKLEGYLASLSR